MAGGTNNGQSVVNSLNALKKPKPLNGLVGGTNHGQSIQQSLQPLQTKPAIKAAGRQQAISKLGKKLQ